MWLSFVRQGVWLSRPFPATTGLMRDGEGCATSPTISRDGTTVYAGDNLEKVLRL